MKIELKYLLLCDDVRKEINGKQSHMGIFEKMSTSQVPLIVPVFFVTGKFQIIEHTSNTIDVELIVSQDNDELQRTPMTMRVGANNSARLNIRFLNFLFPRFGSYTFTVKFSNEISFSTNLEFIDLKDFKQIAPNAS